MKEFIEILKKHRDCDDIMILSVTLVGNGYLLVVCYEWGDVDNPTGRFEEAVLIIEEQYGPNKGNFRIGWTHKIHEDTDEVN